MAIFSFFSHRFCSKLVKSCILTFPTTCATLKAVKSVSQSVSHSLSQEHGGVMNWLHRSRRNMWIIEGKRLVGNHLVEASAVPAEDEELNGALDWPVTKSQGWTHFTLWLCGGRHVGSIEFQVTVNKQHTVLEHIQFGSNFLLGLTPFCINFTNEFCVISGLF
jgi:hypothetical protein